MMFIVYVALVDLHYRDYGIFHTIRIVLLLPLLAVDYLNLMTFFVTFFPFGWFE
jgi:hypothetical protein